MKNNEISVVVQGPIYGNSNMKEEAQFTKRVLQSIRYHLPEAEIILSTWANCEVQGLTYDKVILNKDPGTTNDVRPLNVNRQIVSSLNGLMESTRKYALKLRSDLILEGSNFIDYFRKYDKRSEQFEIFRERIVVCDLGTIHYARGGFLFSPTDWCFFGLREDLINLFNIPLCNENEMLHYFSSHAKPKKPKGFFLDAGDKKFSSEQYIWISCLNKFYQLYYDNMYDVNQRNIEASEIALVNNFIPVDLDLLNMRSLKYPQAAVRGTGIAYTDMEWKKLYNKYCDATVAVKSEIKLKKRFVKILYLYYPIMISFFQKKCPNFFNWIRRMVRKDI